MTTSKNTPARVEAVPGSELVLPPDALVTAAAERLVEDALSCDEYPFFTSRQGGPGASLRLVPGWEQNRQGGFLRNFYAACGIGQGDDYVVAPAPSSPATTFRC